MFSKKTQLLTPFILGSCFISMIKAIEIDTQKQSRPREILTKIEINNLQTKTTQNRTLSQKADIIIISENNPKYLRQMVESITKYAPEIERIYVLKDPCYGQYRDLYNSIKSEYNAVEFIKVGPSNFKSMLESIVSLNHNKHVLISTSNVIFTEYADLQNCIEVISQKNSPLFYQENPQDLHENNSANNCTGSENQKITCETSLLQNTDNLEILENETIEESPIPQDNVFMWQFKNNSQDTFIKKDAQMAIYEKSNLINMISPLNYTCLQELLEILK